MPNLTLLRQLSPLASPDVQRRILNEEAGLDRPAFAAVCARNSLPPLRAAGIETLQVNVGKLCNQTCRHCHVDAGPDRRENMTEATADACLAVLQRSSIRTLDMTGGAPEMNPQFRRLVTGASALSRRIIDRSNLTILVAPGYEDLPQFLAEHRVEIVASLPCYLEENVDRQRGERVFQRSLTALQRLNALGYGQPDSPLSLSLVFNPQGPSLPPDQRSLEESYRQQLRWRYGIEFTQLYTITNMPISRFLDDLLEAGQYEHYMQTLVQSFNPATFDSLMCRTTLSVDWQGNLHDCDFNQMLELGLDRTLPKSITELDEAGLAQLAHRPIVTGQHCFGCTAGAGSSCLGSLRG